jgi:hypothetical protein
MNFGNFGKLTAGLARPVAQSFMPAAQSFGQANRAQLGAGGFMPRGGSGMSPFGGMMAMRPMMGPAQGIAGGGGLGGAAGSAMGSAMGGIMSDERSKEKIRTLEDELQRTYAALGGPSATANVQPEAPDTAALDAAYRRPTSNSYEYKDPSIPGAAPGRQAGPMADELKGLPGVVAPGPDGLDRVDTGRLTMTNASEIANLRREMDALLGKIESGQSNPGGTY